MENKFPKNVRQIGNVSDTPKIYVEDYVDTFLNQVCDRAEEDMLGLFLVGHMIRQEEQDCIYVSGAIRMRETLITSGMSEIAQEAWENAQKEKQEYFPDGEIIGWCVVSTSEPLQLEREWKRIHEQYFNHFGTILILKDAEEESYYAYKYKELMQMNGHYIYYEKNVAMQDYMISERKEIGVTPSENVEDKATQEFRNIVKERIVIREERKSIRYMRAICAILLITILGMGVAMANNYGRMQALQVTIDNLGDGKNKDIVETNGVVEEISKPDGPGVADGPDMVDSSEGANDSENVENQEETQETTAISTMQEMSEDIYIVEKGDTLAKISKKVYGDISHVDAICRMNGLSDGNLIFIGQKLLLP